MKKIYSFLLIATALLFSTNLKAAPVELTQDNAFTELTAAAFNHVPATAATYDFILNEDINLGANALQLAGNTVNLNLNGKTLTFDGLAATAVAIHLYKGTLNINGSGTITTDDSKVDLIRVYGAWEDVADWSTLTIDKGVNISSLSYNAITIDCHATTTIGGTTIEGTKFGDPTSHENDPSRTKADGTKWKTSYGHAYGVNVTINGTVYGYKYGIKVNGYVVGEGTNVPQVAIGKDAHVSCYGSNTGDTDLGAEAVAVYSSGIGNFVIEGEVTGNNAVVLKGGSVAVQGGAKIVATGQWNPVTEDSNSGVGASGSAITLITQSGYAGNAQLTVKDNATVSSEYGYAVYEGNKQGENNSTVSGIHIESGTFSAGTGENQGVISGSQALLNNDKVTVDGGNFTDATILDYVNTNSVIVAEDSEGEVKYTLTPKPEGATEPVVTPGEDPVLNDVSSTDIVKLQYGTTGQTLTTDVECAYLSISNAQTVTIPAGKTLTVGTVVLGEDAQIVVEAGATLKVTGSTGIVAFNSNNLIVEASEAARGILLITPEATANTHPKATVNYVASSYKVGPGEFVFQYMGHPMYNGSVTEVSMAPASTVGFFNVWNGTTYDKIGYINSASTPQASDNLALFNRDFGFYALQTNNAQGDKPTVTFKGQVNGNNDAALRILNQWTTASNGYLGYIDNEAILSAVSAWGATPYVYQYYIDENGDLKWQAKGSTLRPLSDIAPMEPMMFYRNGAQDVTLDYSALVWNPATGEAVPAPSRATNDMTMATINVKGEGCEDEVIVAQTNEEGAPKYLSGKLNLYVSAEEKMDIYTAEDLNNTLIGYQVAKAGVYTMTFNNVQGNALTLVDLANGAQVNIKEGATYTFAASANETNDARFQIVEARKMPTDVETIEAAKAQKGIYSLVGAYLGEDFDVLPAGIYVVNGVKVVK